MPARARTFLDWLLPRRFLALLLSIVALSIAIRPSALFLAGLGHQFGWHIPHLAFALWFALAGLVLFTRDVSVCAFIFITFPMALYAFMVFLFAVIDPAPTLSVGIFMMGLWLWIMLLHWRKALETHG